MGSRERALRKGVEGAPLPGAGAPDGDVVREKPAPEIDAGALLRRSLPGEEPGDMPEPLCGHESNLIRGAEDLCPPVWALRRAVALSRYSPVEFPYPGSVVVCGVDRHSLVREEGVEGGEDSLHESGCLRIVWKVDPVEEMGAVPGVRPDGFREPLLREVAGYPLRGLERRVVLGVGRRDPARPNRVDVDREPAPADDVGVRGRRVFPGEPHLDPVCPPGKERRVHRVQGDVYPGDRGIGVEGFRGPGEGLVVIEVARVGGAVGKCPDLDNAAGKDLRRPADFAAHTVTPKKRGALAASPQATRRKETRGMIQAPSRVRITTARPAGCTAA